MTDPSDASTPPAAVAAPASAPPPAVPKPPQERLVTTEHRFDAGGTAFDYTVTCGTLLLRDFHEPYDGKDATRKSDKPRASFFFIAYARQGGAAESRPVTFSFNGGPGSSSVWLHLGLLGPHRVATDDMGHSGPPPYALEDNPLSLLAESDLVFIDPVGTGHSRMAEGEKAAEFHDYQRDLDAVGEFIRLYLNRYGRWSSPKYLIGESYGTTRAAGLSLHLQDRHDIFLNGVMLVSMAVDMQTLSFDDGNELPFPLFLPTYAATAWYHRALGAELLARPLAEVVAGAEAFANGAYHTALMHGSRLDAAERERVADELARWSGLSPAYVRRCDLRPNEFRYFKELLRERGQTVGRLDSRFLGQDRDDVGEHPETDPMMSAVLGAYAAGINRLLADRFAYRDDAPYVVHAPIWDKWTWKDHANKYVNVSASLRKAMQANPHMRVYVASGYYDLGTPHAAGDYTLAHLGLREPLTANISVSYFEAGHMMYIHRPSFERMAAELRAFVRGPQR